MGIICSKTLKNQIQGMTINNEGMINNEERIQQISAKDFICNVWVPKQEEWIQIQIKITEEKQIQYLAKDQSIIRIDALEDIPLSHQILTNLEQIKNLKWEVEYGKKNQKFAKFSVSWKGKKLSNVGGYYLNNGLKQGRWGELFEDFKGVYYSGEYYNEMRIGFWKQTQYNMKIGGGLYNNYGQQNGKWIELFENFSSLQLTCQGEYKNGKKVGCWNIYHYQKLVGGGICHNSTKIGKWTEFIEGSTLSGQYNQYGKKCSYWDIYENGIQIGGGFYDDKVKGDSIKEGRWKEKDWIVYYKNGRKVGGKELYVDDF
ncbi:unnamed protein product [Paramecium sonneborni]|uniref:MORN repeat protein n=1 Tax=Paramecium sonneborni TaxID=65129 RepID=A0A8S1QX63_9CILI|nr:unnamed protein product [Paramecium sonneborni]